MKLIRVKAVARKEIIQILRDPGSLIMAILMPICMIILYGYSLSLDVDNIVTAVLDQDRKELSREYLNRYRGSTYFDVKYYPDSYKELTHLMDTGVCTVAIVIPSDFTKKLSKSDTVSVQVMIDGSDTNTAGTAQGYVTAITQLYNLELAKKTLDRAGIRTGTKLDNRIRVLFNSDMESKNFIVPGLIAVIIMVIASLLTSLTVAKEWDRGTMEQLIATPITPRELITGKLIPYIIIGFIDVLLAVATGTLIFQVPMKGNLMEILLYSLIFLTGVMSWGIMISVVAKNQLVATQMSIVSSFLPSFLLSGFMFPIYCMPGVIQYITLIVPARYLIVIMRGIFLKGTGIKILWPSVLLLFIYALIVYNNACFRFKKKLM